MLDDFAITPARVRWIMPCGNQSVIVLVSRVSEPGTLSRVCGVTLPASMSALSVSAFSTDPGS